MSRFPSRSLFLGAAGLLALSCGESSPAAPEPSPTPTPAAVATPTPAPTPVNARLACGVGRGTGDGLEHNCPRSGESFLIEVDQAINRVVGRRPEYFDLSNQRGAGGYFVRNVDAYYRDVVQELGNMGLCALVDGGGEIAVKGNNNFSDQYHIMISSGHVRRGQASYRATCVPAWF
ncbi:MAG TPA: hypothetical protein VMR21_05995 [Vicinamibacteria bacterium]|nr:hypothetical protein [Vicinamibacteria bacterium]